jgi:hypothetical protein
MKKNLYSTLFLLFVLVFSSQLNAQITPSLSIQGILKKSNGVAVEDGNYSMTFKLYDVATGGSPLWQEPQSAVEVSNGIYSTILPFDPGAYPFDPNTVKFDKLYYLGVTVGSAELTPRILLTSAPYALALIGTTNKFPSGGKVIADSIQVNGSVLARGGTPGLNGVNRNGYAFSGNSGDKDSGMFSTADGKVSLYANNTEVLAVTPTNVQSSQALTVQGVVTSNGVNISNNNSLAYNGEKDWRLVSADYLESGADGWGYAKDDSDDRGAWKNPVDGACPVVDFGDFAGKALKPANNDYVLKKEFSPAGTYNYVKVVFKFYAIGNWDPGDLSSPAFAAFANNSTGGNIRVGWKYYTNDMGQNFVYNYTQFTQATSFSGNADVSDHWVTGTMIGSRSTPFWVYFGYANNESEADEEFAVGSIEVWVK